MFPSIWIRFSPRCFDFSSTPQRAAILAIPPRSCLICARGCYRFNIPLDCRLRNVLGCEFACVCVCVRAWAPLRATSSNSNSLFLVLLCFLQGRKEPVSLCTVQTTAGRLPLCRAGAHPRAHPGLRQEGREAFQMAWWLSHKFRIDRLLHSNVKHFLGKLSPKGPEWKLGHRSPLRCFKSLS